LSESESRLRGGKRKGGDAVEGGEGEVARLRGEMEDARGRLMIGGGGCRRGQVAKCPSFEDAAMRRVAQFAAVLNTTRVCQRSQSRDLDGHPALGAPRYAERELKVGL
jgi:hypothetical protein